MWKYLLFVRDIDVCHETLRLWWNRFGRCSPRTSTRPLQSCTADTFVGQFLKRFKLDAKQDHASGPQSLHVVHNFPQVADRRLPPDDA